jgi:UDP-glucose 4-epimerase
MIAITGSHGFVGQALIRFAQRENFSFKPISRQDYVETSAYVGCVGVIHLAGLAHRKSAPLRDYMETNCDLAINCARSAARAGAKRFVYVSSSKALSNHAENELPLDESTAPSPSCDYGRSKLAAETELLKLHQSGVIEVVVIRPALVLGSPPKANLKAIALAAHYARRNTMVHGILHRIFANFSASKSFTTLDNLCSALFFTARSKYGGGQIYHVVEDESISSSILFQKLEAAASFKNPALHLSEEKKRSLNASHNQSKAKFMLTRLLRSQAFDALSQPFVLDGKKIQLELGWKPQPRLDVELQRIMASLSNLNRGWKG